MINISTRDEIIGAADVLFYQRGYEHTTFADIAEVVRISRGNFYHHFKTKDEILDAVIAKRLSDRRSMIARWETERISPEARIRSFIDILIVNGDLIKLYGCPIGTLTGELAKLDHTARDAATGLFMLFRAWLREQFRLLGRDADSDELAMRVLAQSQGIAAISNAFHDEAFVRREVEQMYEWLETIASGRRSNTPA